MTGAAQVKICGIKTKPALDAAIASGAAYIGFVFFLKSPRNITVEQARLLAADVPPGVCKVALVVDLDDASLDAIVDTVPLDMIQLHGSETPERVAQVRKRYGLPVMKAVGIADQSDLEKLTSYMDVADQILVDAKPPKSGELPGGNGISFDWSLISGLRWPIPWMLAGGLTPENVMRAMNLTGANQVDVSSGVEVTPGEKDLAKISAFLNSAGVASAPKL